MSGGFQEPPEQQPDQNWSAQPPQASPTTNPKVKPVVWAVIAGGAAVMLIAMLLCGFFLFTRLTQDTPEKSVDAFLTAVKEHNNPAAYEQICGQSPSRTFDDDDLTADANLVRWEIVDVKKTDAIAEVTVRLVEEGEDGPQNVVFTLTEDDGDWRICGLR